MNIHYSSLNPSKNVRLLKTNHTQKFQTNVLILTRNIKALHLHKLNI